MKRLIVCILMMAVWSGSAQAAGVISINFQGGRNPAHGSNVTSTAGYLQVSNWNNAVGTWGAGGGPSSLSDLIDDSGNNTGASVTYETLNTWEYETGDGSGGDADMMSGFLDNIGAGDPGDEITISGIPYEMYSVYVYFNRTSDTYLGASASDGSTSNTLYARNDGTGYPLSIGNNGYAISTDDNAGDGWTAANVMKFSGFTGSTLTIDNAPDPGAPGTYKFIVNGIQIRELTHEIQNGSFEEESLAYSSLGPPNSEIGTCHNVTNFNLGGVDLSGWGYYEPVHWVHPGWGQHLHMIVDTNGTAVFPDGDYAMSMTDLGETNPGMIEQEDIYLKAGELYDISVDAWSENTGDAFITVELEGSDTNKVMDNLTVANDGAYETMTARFTAPATEVYTLRIYSEDAGDPQPDLFIDNIRIEFIRRATVIIIR